MQSYTLCPKCQKVSFKTYVYLTIVFFNMERWKDGNMEGWKDGKMEIWKEKSYD